MMPIIKARTTRRELARHITQLYRENEEELYAYAAFIKEPTAYVLNELIETVLRKDADYKKWREGNPQSFVPLPGQPKAHRRPSAHARTSAGRAGIQVLPPPA
jgi:hypothetical protein